MQTRDSLVLRNQRMAEAFHRISLKHRIRRTLLQAASQIPIFSTNNIHKRILLIRPDHVGDVLLATPAIRALKQARPDLEIHALVGSWSADVLGNYDELDVVLTMPFPGFHRDDKTDSLSPYQQLFRSARQLRKIGYSAAVILRPDHWWGAMLAYFAGIPQRIGYNLPDGASFLTQKIALQHEHVIRQNLRLVEHWTDGINMADIHYQFPVEEDDRHYIDDYLAEWQIAKEQPIICIHPGSGATVKLWTEQNWAKVADTLIDQLEAPVIFTGSKSEIPLIQQIMAYMQNTAYIIAGDTRIGQLAALYQRVRVVLGPDSGPMHLAAAVNTPTVTLFGPADPIEFSPWGTKDKHKIITTDIGCRPCRVLDWRDDNLSHHPCVREIKVGQVLEAARLVTNSH